MPQRIQRSRAKGSRLPAGALYVGRPTVWGNPFVARMVRHGFLTNVVNLDHPEAVVGAYREWLTNRQDDTAQYLRSELRAGALTGHDLACWCPADRACHADVLLELAVSMARVP